MILKNFAIILIRTKTENINRTVELGIELNMENTKFLKLIF